jgi:hypothetical protein
MAGKYHAAVAKSWCACYISSQICHNEIHATLTETELAREYNSIDALRAHPRLARFIAWVGKRPADFHSRSPGARRKR